LQVPWCLLHVFLWCLARCPLRVVCGTLSVGSCRMHVASCPFSAARPSAPVSRSVRCLSPVPSRVSSCCMFCVASRPLHVARCTFPVASCLLCVACPILHAVCWMLQNAFSVASCLLSVADPILACRLLHVVCCNVAERHSAVAYAAHRGGASQLSASVAGKTRYRPRCA
jgi:hypothetical protein